MNCGRALRCEHRARDIIVAESYTAEAAGGQAARTCACPVGAQTFSFSAVLPLSISPRRRMGTSPPRRQSVSAVHLAGFGVAVLLTATVAGLLWRATENSAATLQGAAVFFVVAAAAELVAVWLLRRGVLDATSHAEGVARRVAQGELGIPAALLNGAGRDGLTRSMAAMLER